MFRSFQAVHEALLASFRRTGAVVEVDIVRLDHRFARKSGILVLLMGIIWFRNVPAYAADQPSSSPTTSAAIVRGRQLAKTFCIRCHLFPEPSAIVRSTWHDEILPRMKYRLGFSTPQLEQSANIKLLRANNRLPTSPVITEEQWVDLVTYFLSEAPTEPPPQDVSVPIDVGVPDFRLSPAQYRSESPSVTSIKIHSKGGALVAEDDTKSIAWLGTRGQLIGRLVTSNSISAFRPTQDGLLVAMLGSFLPSDDARGGVVQLRNPSSWEFGPPILSGLPRTTDINAADLNGDGRTDWVVSCFGNNLGRLFWLENRADGARVEHELFGLPGVLRTEIADFNGDGYLDIVALVAQETESMFLFVGNGKGTFTRKTLFQRPPYWGHSYFELIDLNRDGRPDFLVTNGDNGEFSSHSKRFHGVRIYVSQPGGDWIEKVFIPMYGAFKAVGRDFDRDGDLDIAAVSYFPDYQRAPRGSFLFLRNDGPGFKAFTFAESALGRWLTLDAGDVDGDGDDDILLGSYIKGPTAVPEVLMKAWLQARQPLAWLENRATLAGPPGK